MSSKEIEVPEYDSNPFTLSFKGFGLLIDYAKGVFIAILVFSFLGFLTNIASYIPGDSTPMSSSSTGTSNVTSTPAIDSSVNWAMIGGIAALVVGVLFVVIAVSVLISAAYNGFVAAGAVAAVERRKITAGEAFSEMGSRFGVLFSAHFNIALRTFGGYLLFIVPGIRAQLRYQSTPYIIMSNKDISATDAVKSSKDLYRNHLMEAMGISSVGALIPFIGSAIAASGMALSVQQLTAYSKLGKATPKTHILNYIGFIFIAFIFLFMAMIGLLIAIAANN